MISSRQTGRLSEREVEREARRLFPRLARDQGYFQATGARGALEPSSDYGLFTRRNAFKREIEKVSPALVDAFKARQWLICEEGRWGLSDTGCAWLRRLQAGADPFREQHQQRSTEFVEIDCGSRRPALRNDAESPIAWLHRRKGSNGAPLINRSQFEAGERLRKDFTMAGMMPRITSSWEHGRSSHCRRRGAYSGPDTISDTALAAKQKVTNALEAVGPELAEILVDVCCYLKGLEDSERVRGWPRRSGKVVLQIALSRLARHYGLLHGANGKSPKGNTLRHWGRPDFRPSLKDWM